jgi:hypothetical protein
LRVAFEALAWGRHVNDYRDAWEVVRRADHPSIDLVLDTFHILVRGTDLRPIHAIPKNLRDPTPPLINRSAGVVTPMTPSVVIVAGSG